MTLKEAFKEWGRTAPKLWAGYRPEFTHVFLSEHGKDDVRQFTDFYVRKLMGKNKSTPRVQTRALAALVHTLEFAYKEGICQKPSFTPQSVMAAIASSNNPDKDAQEKESTQVLGEEEPAETSPQRSSNPKPRGSGRQQVKVSQLDPFTCKVVATFNSITEASTSTGANTGDISKAVKNKLCRHGFYWCLKGQEEEFRPAKKPRMRTKKKNIDATPRASLPSRLPVTDKSTVEKGGAQKDSCNPSAAIRADLSTFSDEELRDELERRGWYGTLYKRLGFENVKK